MESVWCNLGIVTDLSNGGMRIICKKVPPSPTKLELHGCDMIISLDAKVAWSTRLGFRKHEVGLELQNVTPKIARQLTTLAMTNRIRRLAG